MIYRYISTMWQSVRNSRTISVVVDGYEYEEFKKLLPRGKTFGEYIRKVMREELELRKKEKNLSSPNFSPVRSGNHSIQNTLDKYFPNHLMDYESFKKIVESLSDADRTRLTVCFKERFGNLEAVNKKRTGARVFPFAKF